MADDRLLAERAVDVDPVLPGVAHLQVSRRRWRAVRAAGDRARRLRAVRVRPVLAVIRVSQDRRERHRLLAAEHRAARAVPADEPRGASTRRSRRSTPSSGAPATCCLAGGRRASSAVAARSRFAASRWSNLAIVVVWLVLAASLARENRRLTAESAAGSGMSTARHDAAGAGSDSGHGLRTPTRRSRRRAPKRCRREREEKAKNLEPPEPNRLERGLMAPRERPALRAPPESRRGAVSEDGQHHERQRILDRPGIPAPRLFGGHADFSTFAAASLTKYWMIDARLQMPRLASNRAGVERLRAALRLSGRGLLRSRTGLARARTKSSTAWPVPSLARPAPIARHRGSTSGAASSTSHPTVRRRDRRRRDPQHASIRRSAWRAGAAGDLQVRRRRSTSTTRQPRGNPRRGGRYALTYQRFDDRDRRPVLVRPRRGRPAAVHPAAARPARPGAARARLDVRRRRRGRGPVLSPANARRSRRPPRLPTLPVPRPEHRSCSRRSTAGRSSRRWTARSSTTPARSRHGARTSTCSDLESRLRHRIPVRHDQRRVPPRRGRVRQHRGHALHLEVRPCLLKAASAAGPLQALMGAGRLAAVVRPRLRRAHVDDEQRHAGVLPGRSAAGGQRPRARRRQGASPSKAATATTSPSTRSSSPAITGRSAPSTSTRSTKSRIPPGSPIGSAAAR